MQHPATHMQRQRVELTPGDGRTIYGHGGQGEIWSPPFFWQLWSLGLGITTLCNLGLKFPIPQSPLNMPSEFFYLHAGT